MCWKGKLQLPNERLIWVEMIQCAPDCADVSLIPPSVLNEDFPLKIRANCVP